MLVAGYISHVYLTTKENYNFLFDLSYENEIVAYRDLPKWRGQQQGDTKGKSTHLFKFAYLVKKSVRLPSIENLRNSKCVLYNVKSFL